MSPGALLGTSTAAGCGENGAAAHWWRKAFWCLAAAHLVVWTLFPIVTQPNVSLDVVEIVYWGHEWQWGYFKHPPLASWLSEAACVAAGDLGIYLLAQTAVLTAFWAVWRTAREMVGPRAAFFAILILECCPFYNLWTSEFNHGVCMCASWALAILCFYRAVDRGQARNWAGTGLCLGLGLLTKYNTATLIPPMLLFMVVDRQARRHWRTAGPYLTMVIALVVVTPNLWWSLSHGLPGLTYVRQRTQSQPHLLARVVDPLEFVAGQAILLLPALTGLAFLTGFRIRWRPLSPWGQFQRRFLGFVCLGPVACYLAISIILNMNLTSAYGTQLWLFGGLLAVVSLELDAGPRNGRWSAAWCVGWALGMFATASIFNLAHPYVLKRPARIHFPGAALARGVEERWAARFGVPLPIAAGEWWLAGNVNFYGAMRPSVYCGGPDPYSLDLLPAYSHWTNDNDLNCRGGVILWNADAHGEEFPPELTDRFPIREVGSPLVLAYQTGAAVPPLRVGIACIPPGADGSAAQLAARDGPSRD